MKRRAVQCPQVARLPTRATTAVFDGFTLRVPLADDAAHLASHGVWGKGTHSRSAPRLARDLKKAKAKRDSKLRRPNHEIEYGKEQLQLLYEEAFFLAQRGLLDVRRAQAEDAVDISPDVAPARPSSAGASKTHKTAAAAPPGAPAAAGGEAGEPAPCSGGAGAGAVTSSAAAGASDPAGAAQQLSPAERKALRLQRSRRRAELRWKMPHRPERAAVGPVLSVQDLWTVFCARKPDFPSRFAVYSYCRTRNWCVVHSSTSECWCCSASTHTICRLDVRRSGSCGRARPTRSTSSSTSTAPRWTTPSRASSSRRCAGSSRPARPAASRPRCMARSG